MLWAAVLPWSGFGPDVRLSLRVKWTLVLLLTGGLPLLLFAGAALWVQRTGLFAAALEAQVGMASAVAATLHDTVEQAAEATHRIGQVLFEPEIPQIDARLRLANDLLLGAPALSAVAMYSPDGVLIDVVSRAGQDGGKAPAPASDAAKGKTDLPERLPMAKLGEGRGRWLSPRDLVGDSGAALPSGTRLLWVEPVTQKGQRRALVAGVLSSEAILGELSRYADDHLHDQPDSLILLDRELRLLAVTRPSGQLRVGDSLRDRDLLAALRIPEAQLAEQRVFSAVFDGPAAERRVGSLRTLPEYGWLLGIRQSEQVVLSSLAKVKLVLLIAGSLVIVVALGVGAFMALKTTQPVRALMTLARAYGERRFAERSTVQSRDELEDLGGAMMQMADRLEASEHEIARRARTENDLSRFLPSEVAKAIANGERALTLGGQRRHVTVLFADVASFTPFAESSSPERAVEFLNELFSIVTAAVFRHGGTVDKYIGDCVMAIFGAPTDQPEHCQRALLAAEAIHRFVEAAAPAWAESYGLRAALAIGVSSGEALVGNLGTEQRLEYTAIGDVVNVAARLEGVARGGQTLVTAAVVKSCGPGFQFRALGPQPLRGKQQAVEVYEAL